MEVALIHLFLKLDIPWLLAMKKRSEEVLGIQYQSETFWTTKSTQTYLYYTHRHPDNQACKATMKCNFVHLAAKHWHCVCYPSFFPSLLFRLCLYLCKEFIVCKECKKRAHATVLPTFNRVLSFSTWTCTCARTLLSVVFVCICVHASCFMLLCPCVGR